MSLKIAHLHHIAGLAAVGITLLALAASLNAQTVGPLLADSILYPAAVDAATVDSAGSRYLTQPGKVLKVAPDGITATWTLNVGFTSAARLALDANGNLYGLAFCAGNCTAPTRSFGNGSGNSLALFKIDPTGKLVYLDLFTAVVPSGADLAVATEGTAAITGAANCGFQTSAASYQASCPSSSATHAFAAKVAPDGTLVFATFLGGALQSSPGAPANSAGNGIALDVTGAAYVVGSTSASDFPTTPGALFTSGPTSTSFLVKLGTTGSSLIYGTFLPGAATGVAVDNTGSAHVVGLAPPWTASASCVNTVPTTAGVVEPTFPAELCQPLGGSTGGASPAYVMKFNGTGTALFYSTYLRIVVGGAGGVSLTRNPSIMVDNATGISIVYGQTLRGALLPGNLTAPTPNAIQSVPGKDSFGAGDGVIVKLTPTANQYLVATYLGGAGADSISSLNLGLDGTIWVAGATAMNLFPATGVSGQLPAAAADGFLARIGFGGVAGIILYPESKPDTATNAAILPASLTFATTQVGNSTSQLVGLGNYGGTPLTISSIAVTGDYSQTNNCPASLPAGGHCDITATFKPTARGSRAGTLTATTNANSGVPTATLNGTGVAPVLSASPTTLFFGSQAVGTTSAAKTVTITNTGDLPLAISSVTASGDFAVANTCGSSVAVNASCSLQVTFTPTAAGQRNGTIILISNAVNNPQTVTLSGGIDPDFGIAAAANGSTTQAVTAGQTATYNLVATPVGGFTGTASLSCSGAPTNASCAVNPASLSVTSTASAPFVVTVATAAHSASAPQVMANRATHPLRAAPATLAFVFAGAFLTLWMGAPRRQSATGKRRWFSALAVVGCAAALFVGCGGGSSQPPPPPVGTPAGSYTVVVTAASGTTTHSINLTLTVN